MPAHTYEDAFIILLHALVESITSSTLLPTLYQYWEADDELLLSTIFDIFF